MIFPSNSVALNVTNEPKALTKCPIGFDIGNGSQKVVIGGAEKRFSSYVEPVRNALSTFETQVSYVSGSRHDLENQSWVSGQDAIFLNPSCERVSKHLDGKPRFCLQLLLSAIALMPYREDWQLSIVASVHDAETFKDAIAAALNGTHLVQLGTEQKYSTVQINVLAVLPEGLGAIAECRADISAGREALVLDLGSGTVAATMFDATGKAGKRWVSHSGCDALIDAIAINAETRKALLKEGSRDLIRRAIEDRTFRYGSTGFDLKQIYGTELKPWLDSTISDVLRQSRNYSEAATLVAIGGGVHLPLISELLQKHGFILAQDGLWANARGLFKLAAQSTKEGNS